MNLCSNSKSLTKQDLINKVSTDLPLLGDCWGREGAWEREAAGDRCAADSRETTGRRPTALELETEGGRAPAQKN
jgi:hypothetical protein